MSDAWVGISNSRTVAASRYRGDRLELTIRTHRGVEVTFANVGEDEWEEFVAPTTPKGEFLTNVLIPRAQRRTAEDEVHVVQAAARPSTPALQPTSDGTLTEGDDHHENAYALTQWTPPTIAVLPTPVESETADLRGLGLTAIPAPEGGHTIKILLVDDNPEIIDFTHLSEYSDLQYLSLRRCQLDRIPRQVFELTDLETLDVSENQLSWLGRRKKSLDTAPLGADPYLDPPDVSFSMLPNLRHLNANSNNILHLTEDLANLPELLLLNLGNNQLRTTGDSLRKLTGLKELDISRNPQFAPSSAFPFLKSLRALDISHNYLRKLPISLAALNIQTFIVMEGNRFPDPVPQLAALGNRHLFAYLRTLDIDAKPMFRVKTMLVGEGNVGKTTLVEFLRRGRFVPDLETTHGLEVHTIRVPHPAKHGVPIELRTWDFGGQEIYRITHQFFFTDGSLYLIVWNPREGQESNLVTAWVKRIALRAAFDSRALIVATHADERAAELNFAELAADYPDLVVGHCSVDSKSGTGINEFLELLAKTAASLPQVGLRVSDRWLDLLDRVGELGEPYISLGEFELLAWKVGLEEWEMEPALHFLSELGHVIYFGDDSALREVVILQPDWLSKAIGAVLEDAATRKSGGVLQHSWLTRLWGPGSIVNSEGYSRAFFPFFLRLMERFDVSYRIESSEASLIGQLVPHEEPSIPWSFDVDETNVLTAHFIFDEEPTGLVPWLIVRLHRLGCGVHWRSGLFLRHPVFGSEMLIRLAPQSRLEVEARGSDPSLLFGLLRDTIATLVHSRWPLLKYQVMVPCLSVTKEGPCPGEIPLHSLSGLRTRGVDQIACYACLEMVDVASKLLGVGERDARGALMGRGPGSLLRELESLAADVRVIRNAVTREVADVPTLFSMVPKSGRRVKDLYSESFLLQLWCQEPNEEHPCVGDPYSVSISRDWLRRSAPYLRLTHRILKAVLPVVGSTLDVLSVDGYKQAKADVALMGDLVDKLPTLSTGVDSSDKPVGSLEGAAARAFRELLLDIDQVRLFAGLSRVFSSSGEYLWVCADHRKRYDPGLPLLPTQ